MLSGAAHPTTNASDRRVYLQLAAIASAAELYSFVLAHWFGSRMGDDHEILEELQDRS